MCEPALNTWVYFLGIKVYTKGADSIIIKRLEAGGNMAPYFDETLRHIQEFAEHGLRTLCLATRDLSEEDYSVWQAEYSIAKSDVTDNRETLLERAADKVNLDQCCQIWQFVTNSVTFYVKLWPKFGFGYLAILAT